MIDNLSDQEKSILLAKAMAYYQDEPTAEELKLMYGKVWEQVRPKQWRSPDGAWLIDGIPNYYSPANMALAWRVLNWACDATSPGKYQYPLTDWLRLYPEWARWTPSTFLRVVLDKILELAIEAGIVEVANE